MRRSRAGYIACPGCLAHVRLAAFGGADACPFCSTKLTTNAAGAPIERLGATGKGSRAAFVLATLLGTASVAACGSEESDVEQDATEDADTAQDGETGTDTPTELVDEPVPGDVYGSPADIVDESPPVDLYGIPPEPDASSDTDPSTDTDADTEVEESLPMPEYGLPPEPDAGPDADADEDTEVEESLPMPEYGLPPDPEGSEPPPDAPAYGLPPEEAEPAR